MRTTRTTRRTTLAAALGCALALATVLTVASTSAATGPRPDLAAMAAPEPADQTPQLAEPNTVTGRAAVTGAPGAAPRTVCHQGARWLRLRFTELSLRGADSVTVTGTAGGGHTFTAANWPGRAFTTQAFGGDCVQVSPQLTDPGSRFAVDSYQAGATSLTDASVTVAAVGDLCGSSCNQTAALVTAMNPAALILAGDIAYDSGSTSDFNNKYDPYYGKFKSITYPSPGNHEYKTSGASGYFGYFGTRAKPAGLSYYSFDVGDWHFVSLNSNIDMGTSSAQTTWLKNDLAANTKPCTAAYWHHPRFSGSSHGDQTAVNPLYTALYNARADLVVVGHDHNYQRFAPSKPDGTRDDVNGIRQLLIGTGGTGTYSLDSNTAAVREKGDANTFGVGKLTLSATGYKADFVPVAGRTFTDTVSGTCHKATTTADFGVTVNPTSLSVPQAASGSATVSVASLNGFAGATTLTASGLPAGVQASFSPNPVTPAANGTATATLSLTASASAATGTSTVTVTGTSGALTHTATLQLTVTPAGGGGGTVFADDFESDKGWTVNAAGTDTATSGRYERGDPEQTTDPTSGIVEQRGDTTSGSNCLVTGRLAGSGDGANDVDGGVTSIRSPQITVPATGSSALSFSYTYSFGDNTTSADYLRVKVVDGTTGSTVLEKLGAGAKVAGVWQQATVNLSSYAGRTVHLLVETADASGGSLVEAAVDDVRVTTTGTGAADFTVTAAPTTLSIPQGQKNVSTVSVTSLNGYSESTALTVSGAPAGVSTLLQNNPVTPAANGTATAQLAIATTATAAAGTYDLTVTAAGGTLSRTATVRVTVTGATSAGFADDFETDKGWTVNAAGTDTATSGKWERGDPEQTIATNVNQVKQLGDTTSGSNCLVTGRLAGATDGANDVDGGVTSVRSPQILVPGAANLTFQYNLAHGGNATADDYLRITVIDGGTATTVFEKLGTASTEVNGAWRAQTVNLSAYAGRTVQIQIETADGGTTSLWEAAVDDLAVTAG
ncbi:metallophosphoesterase [Longispora sp. NPDC051575]|uniref:metallophosphoesterase n=1 Tax=Longispora sp. NPDC051575 TaxID=3154943 RepID=UPI003443649F